MVWFAVVGVAALTTQLYAYVGWIGSPDFEPVAPGPDPIPTWDRVWAVVLQAVFTVTALLGIAYAVRSCVRARAFTLDAKIMVGLCSLYWLDPVANWIRPQWTYNAVYVNRGSWTEHIPGWIGDTGRVPQALLLEAPAYPMMIFVVVLGCAFLRALQRRRPQTSNLGLVLALWAVLGMFVFLFEWPLMILTGLARYLQVPEHISLFAGTWYQYPWFELVGWAGMLTAVTSLRFFVDDRGETAVERGLGRLGLGRRLQVAVGTLAVVGFANLAMFGYALTVAPLTLWGNKAPALPSYFHTGLCDSPGKPPCPGPDVPIVLRHR